MVKYVTLLGLRTDLLAASLRAERARNCRSLLDLDAWRLLLIHTGCSRVTCS